MFPLNSVISCFSPLISRAHRSVIYLVSEMPDKVVLEAAARFPGWQPFRGIEPYRGVAWYRGHTAYTSTRRMSSRHAAFCQRLYLAVLESYVEVARWILGGEPSQHGKRSLFRSLRSQTGRRGVQARVSATLFYRAPGARMPREGCRTKRDLLIMHVYMQAKLQRKIRWIW